MTPRFLLDEHVDRIGRIIEELHLIWSASTAEEYHDCMLFLPL